MAVLPTPVLIPAYLLNYAGVNITANIGGMVTEFGYTDKAEDHSDELEIMLADADKLWQGPWLPTRGDTIVAQLGYTNGQMLDCGTFQVDELELDGPPDTFHLKCIAAGITQSLRTKRSVGYENGLVGNSLLDVANQVAQRQGMTVVGLPNSVNITLQRITQHHETDMKFLHRLSWMYDYDFSVRGNQLIFYSRDALQNQPPVTTVDRTDVTRFSFTLKSVDTYEKAQATYLNPDLKALLGAQYTDTTNPTGNIKHIVSRLETPQQATLRAAAGLHGANMFEVTARITMPGDVLVLSGVNVTITGFGAFSGNWFVTSSKHRLERGSGYSTEFEARQL